MAVKTGELVQAVVGEAAAEGGLEEGGWVGVGSENAGEDDAGAAPNGRRCDGSSVGPQLDVYPDACEVGPDDLAGFDAARVAADGQDGASGARACQCARPPEVGSADRVDLPPAGAGHAWWQVIAGGEVAERRGERGPVERVAGCPAQPWVGEQAVPGVKGQLVR